jgi:hypothetical protein
MRHEPKAFSVSVAHSFGTDVPARAAARMTEVLDGTVTGLPSISTVTDPAASTGAGVPRSS